MILLLKFKAWLRNWLMLDHQPSQMGGAGNPATISDGAAQLVERARAGDQNALAMICEIRDRAKAGNPRAKKSFQALEHFIKQNPFTQKPHFGQESVEVDLLCQDVQSCFAGEADYVETVTTKMPEIASLNVNKAVVTLANGPNLLPENGLSKVKEVSDALGDEDKQAAFKQGYQHGMRELDGVPEHLREAFILGHLFGTARRIQAVRIPGVPVSILSPGFGLELGENVIMEPVDYYRKH